MQDSRFRAHVQPTVPSPGSGLKKYAVLVHGIDGKPDGAFRPWLRSELEKNGFEVIIPKMPNSTKPTLASWVMRLMEAVPNPNENYYLLGHSAGGAASLAYVQALEQQMIGGLILVAGCCKPLEAVRKTWDFFPRQEGEVFDWEKIKASCGRFAAIHSDNDSTVPQEHAKMLVEKLDAEMIVCPGMGHFHTADGASRLPVARDIVLDWAGIKTRQSWSLIPPGF